MSDVTCWRWSNFCSTATQMVTDKVFIATALLSNMYNVHDYRYAQYFQDHIDLLSLTNVEKADVLEFIYLTTHTIYSKADWDVMLPKYLHSLRVNPDTFTLVGPFGQCCIIDSSTGETNDKSRTSEVTEARNVCVA